MKGPEFTSFYIVVRLWAPPEESNAAEKPRYIQSIEVEGEPVRWTTTDDWRQAHFFKSGSVAGRVVYGVDRFRSRIARGWVYEIVKVTEEILSSNLDEQLSKEEA